MGISSPNFYSRRESRDELWSTNKKSYCAHTDTPEVLVRCKLMHVHTPRGSRIQFLESFAREFRISKFTLYSDLRRRAASRRALPCPSSYYYNVAEAYAPRIYRRQVAEYEDMNE